MFEFQRLAKEDYELMGRCSTWTDTDAANMLASFEMEVSRAFGESQELFQFSRLGYRNSQGLEKTFHDMWSKWLNFITDAIEAGDILYSNTPVRDAPPADTEATVVQVIGYCNFEPKELLTCIYRSAAAGHMSFDIEEFSKFLHGNGNAPERSKIVQVEIPPQEYLSAIAKKSHIANKSKQDGLRDFLKDDLSGGCTCTKRQAVARIFRERFKEDDKYLKAQTGYCYLSFTREVSKAIRHAEEKKPKNTRINRHENTDGFQKGNVPACTKHPSK